VNVKNYNRLHALTLKVCLDLRKQFEEQQNVKLNRDGRAYFREITARFMNIYQDCHKHKETSITVDEKIHSGTKRKTSE